MKKLTSLFAAFVLAITFLAPVAFTGCGTTTHEAVVFHTFQDTWAAAHAAYGGFCERVVQGKVSKEDEAKADAAWNRFREGFRVALKASSVNWSAATPAGIQQLANELLAIIRKI